MARRVLEPDERNVPTARPLTDFLGSLESNTIWAPILAQLQNRQLYSPPDDPRKIVEPGMPADQAAEARIKQFLTDIAPGQVRGIQRVMAAREGRATSGSKSAEAQGLNEAILQGILGIPIVRAEGLAERQERTAPLVEKRFATWERAINRLEEDLRLGRRENTFAGQFDVVPTIPALKELQEDAKKYARSLQARLVDKEGKMTKEDEAKLLDAWMQFLEISNRMDRLDAEERARRR